MKEDKLIYHSDDTMAVSAHDYSFPWTPWQRGNVATNEWTDFWMFFDRHR